METDRGLPDALDQVEDVGTLLVAHGIAQDPPKQADVVAQPRVLLERLGVVGPIGAKLGLGRHDLGGHCSCYSRNARQLCSLQLFCRSARRR